MSDSVTTAQYVAGSIGIVLVIIVVILWAITLDVVAVDVDSCDSRSCEYGSGGRCHHHHHHNRQSSSASLVPLAVGFGMIVGMGMNR
jgi:hypothetical protein